VAKRGRASRLGERSLGHVDPGAKSVAYLLTTVDEVLQAHCM
jgi:phosphoenolpyruvate---glycerone phosphotransferase subunit DhaL